MEYHHHFITLEASDQSMTVLHMAKTHPFQTGCDMAVIDFSQFNKSFLDFGSGVYLQNKFEVPSPENKSAVEEILSRAQEVMSFDCIDYSLISSKPNKMYCESMVSYILTGEKNNTEVSNFRDRYGIFACLLILPVELFGIVVCVIRYGRKLFSKLRMKLTHFFRKVKNHVVGRVQTVVTLIICMCHSAANLWRFFKKKILKVKGQVRRK
jgi:hypothetical protein